MATSSHACKSETSLLNEIQSNLNRGNKKYNRIISSRKLKTSESSCVTNNNSKNISISSRVYKSETSLLNDAKNNTIRGAKYLNNIITSNRPNSTASYEIPTENTNYRNTLKINNPSSQQLDILSYNNTHDYYQDAVYKYQEQQIRKDNYNMKLENNLKLNTYLLKQGINELSIILENTRKKLYKLKLKKDQIIDSIDNVNKNNNLLNSRRKKINKSIDEKLNIYIDNNVNIAYENAQIEMYMYYNNKKVEINKEVSSYVIINLFIFTICM